MRQGDAPRRKPPVPARRLFLEVTSGVYLAGRPARDPRYRPPRLIAPLKEGLPLRRRHHCERAADVGLNRAVPRRGAMEFQYRSPAQDLMAPGARPGYLLSCSKSAFGAFARSATQTKTSLPPAAAPS